MEIILTSEKSYNQGKTVAPGDSNLAAPNLQTIVTRLKGTSLSPSQIFTYSLSLNCTPASHHLYSSIDLKDL